MEFFFQAEDGIRDFCLSRMLGDVYNTKGFTDAAVTLVPRLTQLSRSCTDLETVNDGVARMVFVGTGSANLTADGANASTITYPQADPFIGGGATGSVVGAAEWGLEAEAGIPEIDIKVDSVAVTAVTKKLKAKWTPELGQDLNAYHNLDAEVELTQILSEQIALEIDREILEDLVKDSRAGIRYWSRSPGKFVNRETGAEIGGNATPDFTGNVSEWYETLVETINDVSAQIHRKTLRGAANFVVCGPEIANILEFTAGFRANVTADADRDDSGAVKVVRSPRSSTLWATLTSHETSFSLDVEVPASLRAVMYTHLTCHYRPHLQSSV